MSHGYYKVHTSEPSQATLRRSPKRCPSRKITAILALKEQSMHSGEGTTASLGYHRNPSPGKAAKAVGLLPRAGISDRIRTSNS